MADPIGIGDNETPYISLNTGGPGTVGNVAVQGGGQVEIFTSDGIDGATVSVGGGVGITLTTTIGVAIPNIPTSDPHMAGYLWSDNGTVKVSAG